MLIRIIKPALSALVQIIVLVAAVVWILDSGAQTMGYSWQWERVPDYIDRKSTRLNSSHVF